MGAQSTAAKDTTALAWAALAYALFIVYGNVVPLDFHDHPLPEAWVVFVQSMLAPLDVAGRGDYVLWYAPLGFLATGALSGTRRAQAIAAGIVVFVLCALLAVGIEFAQVFFPPRTVSLSDIVAETIGAGVGVAAWLAAGDRLVSLWTQLLHGGPATARALAALYALAYLVLALFPFDFLTSGADLAQKLGDRGRAALLVTQSCGGGTLRCAASLAIEVFTVAPLGVFLGMVASLRPRPISLGRAFVWGAVLGVVIEGLQIFVASGISQGASIATRGIGMAVGLAAYQSLRADWLTHYRAQLRLAALLAIPFYLVLLLALSGFFGAALESRWVALEKLRRVHFEPFYYYYYSSNTAALYSLLVHAAAYAPIGIGMWLFAGERRRVALWMAALAAVLAASATEGLKLFLRGKHPDPSDVLIAAAAAVSACVLVMRLAQGTMHAASGGVPASERVPRSGMPGRRRAHGVGFGIILLVGVAALIGGVLAYKPREQFIDESKLPQLPAPNDLPPVHFAAFNAAHPRLPNPSGTDLIAIARQNPALLEQVRARAAGGNGDIEAAVLQALVDPRTVDLQVLHRRLTGLVPSDRGNDQVKPLAVAYDWLYPRWSAAQRAQLAAKLADGCDYVVTVIRRDRMSPYNVILYNAPLQALTACSLALYGDDSRGEALMRFAYDLLKNRVLPVWRQIMGRNGGWHEGGEYVGVGIGQAIYEVPAMWRSATGEDLFASEPEIRGFLDFLVYRRRPDDTDFRWGDGSNFERSVPDAIALALEFRHAAAYTLWHAGDDAAPSSWPWGPLGNPALADPGARAKLPLVKQFDGIGMTVARSDWSPEATYVTFKAGDNYWSHSHLDQGAFTIYKGGALAIDSGVYGPAYGSDHHMNYTYQSIAHNVVTVTDPADTVPAPGKDKPRPIANDGGQRRIGSGWGVEAAPLDRNEWEAKRDIYHTAETGPLFDQGGFAVVTADITPAYTNSRSGNGSFSARTRRVERFWRIFGYDRVDDVVVVFDQVTSTKAAFRKRWLLHTIEHPAVFHDGFTVDVPARTGPGHGGGRLEARVLLPKNAVINAIGGRGLEFFVDDRNYDENGTLSATIRKQALNGAEPGSWRVEVSPPRDEEQDMFLVVLLPSSESAPPLHRVTLLEFGNRVGCEIVGPNRTTRWWFEPGRNAAVIDSTAGADVHHYVVTGPEGEVPRAGLLERIRKLFRSHG